MNKTEGGVYDSDDDDKLNPYLSKSDLESDDESDDDAAIKKEDEDRLLDNADSDKPAQRSFMAQNIGDGFVIVRAPPTFLSGFPNGDWNPNGRKRPAVTNNNPNKKAKIDDGKTKLKISIKKKTVVHHLHYLVVL